MSNDFNCPSCGAELKKEILYTKNIICEYCCSSIFLEDDSIKDLGKVAQLAEKPSILRLGQYFEYRGWEFVPIGRVRYDYGCGWWEEWYVTNAVGETKWVSIDEGNIAIEEKDGSRKNSTFSCDDLSVGDSLDIIIEDESHTFTVTEIKRCKCIGAEGELPFVIIQNEEFNYIDLLSHKGESATIEIFDDGTQDLFLGLWVDPFDIKEC